MLTNVFDTLVKVLKVINLYKKKCVIIALIKVTTCISNSLARLHFLYQNIA